MFLIFGISNGEKRLEFNQTMICSRCGQFGRLELFMTYKYFSLFFIPIFKWGIRYYAKSTCCNRVYEIDRELGRRIKRGETIELSEHELHDMRGTDAHFTERCPICSYPVTHEFDYCPKCGRKL